MEHYDVSFGIVYDVISADNNYAVAALASDARDLISQTDT